MGKPTAYIVTGTTRGIGKSLAEAILARGHWLHSISRTPDSRQTNRVDHHCDLRRADEREAAMQAILAEIVCQRVDDVVLINNAGVLHPITTIDHLTSGQMEDHLQVNLIAPLHLLALFIGHAGPCQGQRRVINIVSGAARHPYAGWSLYCSAKAALSMTTRCAALEQRDRANGVLVCAVAPGVVNTDMQAAIRAADEVDFPLRSRFVEMQAAGRLLNPHDVAALIMELDQGGQFQSGGFYDLRDVVQTDSGPAIAPRPEGY